MAWARREYSKAEIDRMGAALVPWWTNAAAGIPDMLGHAYGVIQNWRSSHGMPLLVFRGHLAKRAERISAQAVVAQRLKRFASIMKKLSREPQMKLSQMQDLGGCRAIMPDMASLSALHEVYRHANDDFVQSESGMRCYDYVKSPKPDGYRGIHLVGRYRARAEKNEHWNGHRIEIQLRTQLQHAFSTAVETVTTFTRQPLKFGGGSADWRRFFALVGTLFAVEEGTAPIPGTPENASELEAELRSLLRDLHVRRRLRGWTKALSTLPKKQMADARWILLILDMNEDTIQSIGFADVRKAVAAMNHMETSEAARNQDIVLVGVNSIKSLRTAYPNYYADTAAFLVSLNRALRKRKKKQDAIAKTKAKASRIALQKLAANR